MATWSRWSRVLRPAIAWSPRAVSSSIAWRRAPRRSVGNRTQRHERDRRLFAQATRPDGDAVRDGSLRRRDRVPRAQHRGLRRSHATDSRLDHAESGPVVRRDPSLHLPSDRNDRGYGPLPVCPAHYLPLRPLVRETAVLVRVHLRAGPAPGALSPVANASADY